MRANQIDRFGPPQVLHLVHDAVEPQPVPGQVRIATIAAGVNPIDYKIRQGSHLLVKGAGPEIFPVVLGREACGVLLDATEEIPAGTTVFGMAGAGLGGCYAETCLLPADGIVAAPDGVDPVILGGSALAWYTAVEAVEVLGRIQADDIVLIHGAGGGVGQIMTQLAVRSGAQVWASASGKHAAQLTAMGAHHLDYTVTDVFAVAPRPTVVIDAVWFGTFAPSMDHLAGGGRMVVLPSLADLSEARRRGIEVSVPSIKPSAESLRRCAALLATGELQIEVGEVFDLSQADRAHQILEDGHASGKIVLRVR